MSAAQLFAVAGASSRRAWQYALHQMTQGSGCRWMSSLPQHTVLGMPSLSPTMDKGNIAAWKVKEGDAVKAGDVLAEVETDKATIAFENQDEGYVAKILVSEGSKDIAINTPLLVLVEDSAHIAAFKNYSAGGAGSSATPAATAGSEAAPATAPSGTASAASVPKVAANHRIGPAARKLLDEAGLSISDVTPTGPNNIVTKGDVLAAIASGVKPSASAPAASHAKPPPPAAPAAQAATVTPAQPAAPATPQATNKPATSQGQGTYTDEPTTQMRRIIAQRLLESKTTIPTLYGGVDVDMGPVAALRKALADQGVKLSVNDFVIKAVAMALKDVPAAAALWDGKAQESRPSSTIDISIAVATDKGLITPIVKDADKKTLAQISASVKDLASRARANKLKPEEFQGGCFTISNLGMYGISEFSAIINPPQGAILAVGGTTQKVRLETKNGKSVPVASNVMTATVSADHRMFDGELLTGFLNAFKKYMNAPANLLL